MKTISYEGVVRRKVFHFLKETGMSRYRFSQLSGISTSTLSDMEKRPDYDIRESNIFKVCKGMGVTPCELFQSDEECIHTRNELENLLLTNFRLLPSNYQERLIGYLQCLHDENEEKKNFD